MKNTILKTITCSAAGVFLGSGAYLLDPRYIGVDGDTWKVACGMLVGSCAWICIFIWANPRHVERFFKKILKKGADIYARYRNKIKRVYRKNYE